MLGFVGDAGVWRFVCVVKFWRCAFGCWCGYDGVVASGFGWFECDGLLCLFALYGYCIFALRVWVFVFAWVQLVCF